MAITVTATEGGATGAGTYIRVKNLGNAVLAGTPATGNSGTAPQAAITTTVTGSVVYAAILGGTNTSLTAAPGTATLYDNIADAVNNWRYGSSHTAVTGTPGAVTVGSSTPAPGNCALLEILSSGGSITELDNGTIENSTTGATTITSPSFTPVPGSLLVALVVSGGSGAVTMAVSDTSGLVWTQRSSNGSGAYAGVWTAQVPAVTVIQAPLCPAAVRPAARSRIITPPAPAGPSTWAAAGTASGTSSASGAFTPALLTGTASSVSAATGAVTMTGPTTWAAAGTAAGASGASGAFTPAQLLASATGTSSASGGFTQVITATAASTSLAAGFFSSALLPLSPVWPQIYSLPLNLSHSPAADPAGTPVPFPNGIVIWNSGGTAFRFVNIDGLPQVIAFMPVYPWAINGDPIVAAPYVIPALSTVWVGAHDVPHYGNRTWIIASSPAVLVTAFEP